ncbi:MAG: hypothetical protein ACYTGK_16940 [Planctomycetota bacterium]|jgi:hypothetical protein
MRVPAVLLIPILLAACAAPRAKPKPHEKDMRGMGRLDMTELGERLEVYCTSYLSVVSGVAAQIDEKTENLDTKMLRTTLQWRIMTFLDFRQALDMPDPRAALIDLWALAIQNERFFREGYGKELFGPHHELTLRVNVDGLELIEAVAADYYTPEAYKEVEAKIREFADAHPVGDLSRRPLHISVAAEDDRSLTWFSRWAGIQPVTAGIDRIADEVDQISWLLTWLPETSRWQAKLMLLDLDRDPTIRQLVSNANTATEAIVRLEELGRELPSTIRKEITLALDEIDTRQTQVRETLKQSQDLMAEVGSIVNTTQETVGTVNETFQMQPKLLAALDNTTASVTRLAEALQPTIAETRGLIADTKSDEATATPPEDKVPPAELLASIEKTSAELTTSTTAIRDTVTELRAILQSNDVERQLTGLNAPVDHIAWRAIQVILVLVVAAVLGALVYRWVAERFL